ncbi:MAG: hypothetical protein ABRQ39_19690 [Candidatus Eremiobacterota bacterium]
MFLFKKIHFALFLFLLTGIILISFGCGGDENVLPIISPTPTVDPNDQVLPGIKLDFHTKWEKAYEKKTKHVVISSILKDWHKNKMSQKGIEPMDLLGGAFSIVQGIYGFIQHQNEQAELNQKLNEIINQLSEIQNQLNNIEQEININFQITSDEVKLSSVASEINNCTNDIGRNFNGNTSDPNSLPLSNSFMFYQNALNMIANDPNAPLVDPNDPNSNIDPDYICPQNGLSLNALKYNYSTFMDQTIGPNILNDELTGDISSIHDYILAENGVTDPSYAYLTLWAQKIILQYNPPSGKLDMNNILQAYTALECIFIKCINYQLQGAVVVKNYYNYKIYTDPNNPIHQADLNNFNTDFENNLKEELQQYLRTVDYLAVNLIDFRDPNTFIISDYIHPQSYTLFNQVIARSRFVCANILANTLDDPNSVQGLYGTIIMPNSYSYLQGQVSNINNASFTCNYNGANMGAYVTGIPSWYPCTVWDPNGNVSSDSNWCFFDFSPSQYLTTSYNTTQFPQYSTQSIGGGIVSTQPPINQLQSAIIQSYDPNDPTLGTPGNFNFGFFCVIWPWCNGPTWYQPGTIYEMNVPQRYGLYSGSTLTGNFNWPNNPPNPFAVVVPQWNDAPYDYINNSSNIIANAFIFDQCSIASTVNTENINTCAMFNSYDSYVIANPGFWAEQWADCNITVDPNSNPPSILNQSTIFINASNTSAQYLYMDVDPEWATQYTAFISLYNKGDLYISNPGPVYNLASAMLNTEDQSNMTWQNVPSNGNWPDNGYQTYQSNTLLSPGNFTIKMVLGCVSSGTSGFNNTQNFSMNWSMNMAISSWMTFIYPAQTQLPALSTPQN